VGNNLSKKTLRGFVRTQIFFALLLFLPTWSLRFWEAWIYLILSSGFGLIITLYFLKRDPGLIERRLEVGPAAEPERNQKIIQSIASVLSCALFIVPGFDHRLHWSAVPTPIVLSADGLFVVGLLIVFLVFKENSYTASVVRVEADQPVISTGPYRLVRRPMYAGAVLGFLATPFALGSWRALFVAVPLCGVIVVRLLYEERFLSANLPGYDAYRQKVRDRLVPYVW